MDAVRYRIDANDEIVAVNDAWDRFAVESGARDLRSPHVLGQSLWRYIAEESVREMHRLLLVRVRDTRGTLEVPFRCDGPDCRRFMHMSITGAPHGEVEFVARLKRSEARAPVSITATVGEPGGAFVTVCSWCNSVSVPPSEWVEIETAVVRLGLLEREVAPRVSHGICGACRARLMEEILPGGTGLKG